MPEDFQMASLYGVPAGSSLVDWPFSLDELAPYYQLAEEFFGVCGDAPLPMPPMQSTIRGRILRTAAEGLGWKTRAVPLLINSVERHGRRACIQCGHCVGFQCPVGAKSGTQNTAIPTAKATGNCTVWPNADVLQILFAEQRAVGVRLLRQGRQEDVLADRVIVSAGAIESARLLLLSGIANDHLGRHLQGHYYPGAWGVMPDPVFDGIGPGVTTATTDFNHGNEGVIGGAMLADDFIMVPSSFALNFNDPNGSRWGLKYKDWIRYTYPRLIEVKGPVHEIPSPTSRVDLDYGIRDALGRPVARLSGATHPETARTANFMNGVAKQWLESAGAAKIQVRTHGVWLSGGQHQAGTCRMSDDPSQGVTDQFGKVHRQEGLYVADGSLHPTNGGFNPVLTIMANSWRVAANIT
jgi:choline dehydrogenase-like flavoprotein